MAFVQTALTRIHVRVMMVSRIDSAQPTSMNAAHFLVCMANVSMPLMLTVATVMLDIQMNIVQQK